MTKQDMRVRKKNQRLRDKAQKQFYKELKKRIKQSSDSSYSPFDYHVFISPNDPRLKRLITKHPFLDFELETKDDIVLFVKWSLK